MEWISEHLYGIVFAGVMSVVSIWLIMVFGPLFAVIFRADRESRSLRHRR
ncbi:hypothetical protein [Rhodophyticola porphyridii]|nr:hypothetical protein [Rhodophyticola porphyridii]